MLIRFIVGDWSGDGHEKTQDFITETNATSRKDIEKAYQAGTKKIGFDLKKDVAADYEDSTISKKYLNLLIEAGICSMEEADRVEPDEEEAYLDAEFFCEIFFGICRLGNPDLTFEVVTMPWLDVGGYGLFY